MQPRRFREPRGLFAEKRGFVNAGTGEALTMVRHSVTIFYELGTTRAP